MSYLRVEQLRGLTVAITVPPCALSLLVDFTSVPSVPFVETGCGARTDAGTTRSAMQVPPAPRRLPVPRQESPSTGGGAAVWPLASRPRLQPPSASGRVLVGGGATGPPQPSGAAWAVAHPLRDGGGPARAPRPSRLLTHMSATKTVSAMHCTNCWHCERQRWAHCGPAWSG